MKDNKCEWCGKYGAQQIEHIKVGGYFHWQVGNFGRKKEKYISALNFCSKKCESEFGDRHKIEYKKVSGCFIATAAYGDYNHPIVLDLRIFRDSYLENKKIGRRFIRVYYKYSPIFAKMIEKRELNKSLTRLFLLGPIHLFIKFFFLNHTNEN
jgi:hypothetical protein